MTADTEKIIFLYMLKNPDYFSTAKDFEFDSNELKILHKIAKKHYEKYKATPTSAQYKKIIDLKNLHERVSDDYVDIIFSENLSNYDDEWIKETTETYIKYTALKASVVDVIEFLKMTSVNPENIESVVEKVKGIVSTKNNVDFDYDTGLDLYNPGDHKINPLNSVKTGVKFYDTVLGGGWLKPSLNVWLGPPKSGKSIFMCNLAAWGVQAGLNVAYITLETSDKIILKRISSNLFNIKMKDYADISNDIDRVKKNLSNLSMHNFTQPGRLKIKEYPMASATIPDIERYLNKTEERENFKFDIVIIDYLGIVKNHLNGKSDDLYVKLKVVSEEARGMAQRNNYVVHSAIQTNRSAFDANDMTIANIAESAAVLHTVDSLFGIIQDHMMKTNCEYYVKVLLNRNEGYMNSKKKFSIMYDYMRLLEDGTTDIIN